MLRYSYLKLLCLLVSSSFIQSSLANCGGDIVFLSGFETNELSCNQWTPARDGNGVVTIDSESSYGTLVFEDEISSEQILTGFPVGHDRPQVENRFFYDLSLDGYGGLPEGSCPKRSYFMDANDPTLSICEANENKDLLRVWGGGNANLQHVLIKNVQVKNAFRTYNVVDGVVVVEPNQLPHTDVFQTFFGGGSVERPEWLVIQDTLFKNSDNNIMISGGTRLKGFVYQNLVTSCDNWFLEDKLQRKLSDFEEFNIGSEPTLTGCVNHVNIGSWEAADVWLIDVFPSEQPDGSLIVVNENAPVVVVGTNYQDLVVRSRSETNSIIDHPNVFRYRYIEDALNNQQRPPLIHLSCAGWRDEPENCESRQGSVSFPGQ